MTQPRPMGETLASLEKYLGSYSDNIAELIADHMDGANIPDPIIRKHLIDLTLAMPEPDNFTEPELIEEIRRVGSPLALRLVDEIPKIQL